MVMTTRDEFTIGKRVYQHYTCYYCGGSVRYHFRGLGHASARQASPAIKCWDCEQVSYYTSRKSDP